MSDTDDTNGSGPFGPIVPRSSRSGSSPFGPIIPRLPSRNDHPQSFKPKGQAIRGIGWKRDLADIRDLTLNDEQIQEGIKTKKLRLLDPKDKPASKIDLRKFCSPVENQQHIGSCTAQAVVGLMEFMMFRSTGSYTEGSRLFVYKTTRNLLHWVGDTGAYIRTAMKAVGLFGVPPEEYYEYDPSKFDDEPSQFVYTMATSYQALNYTRLDPYGKSEAEIIDNVRWTLRDECAVVFGFSVFSSLSDEAEIPVPAPSDKLEGGHAVLAVGYDDDYACSDGSKGALVIRNSWGTEWGENGYGYLPYEYIRRGLASDFWTCLSWEWFDDKQ